jgi:hypothetical protein
VVDLETNPAADVFYSGAMGRIRRMMLVLAAVGTIALAVRFGWRLGVGFVVGSAIAWVNFNWLKRAVSTLADHATRTGRGESGTRTVLRFLLRYLLIAAGAYAIFKISVASLYGLLGGLFLPVAAILCEAVYEAWVALRRGL